MTVHRVLERWQSSIARARAFAADVGDTAIVTMVVPLAVKPWTTTPSAYAGVSIRKRKKARIGPRAFTPVLRGDVMVSTLRDRQAIDVVINRARLPEAASILIVRHLYRERENFLFAPSVQRSSADAQRVANLFLRHETISHRVTPMRGSRATG